MIERGFGEKNNKTPMVYFGAPLIDFEALSIGVQRAASLAEYGRILEAEHSADPELSRLRRTTTMLPGNTPQEVRRYIEQRMRDREHVVETDRKQSDLKALSTAEAALNAAEGKITTDLFLRGKEAVKGILTGPLASDPSVVSRAMMLERRLQRGINAKHKFRRS